MKIEEITSELNLAADRLESYIDEVAKSGNIKQILTVFATLKPAYSALDKARKRVYAQLDYMDKNVVPTALENVGTDRFRVPELGLSFGILVKYSASVKDREALYERLRADGHEDLITETVNAGTLASFLKNMLIDEGVEYPEELVELKTYNATGMNKYTPKP